MSSTDQELRTSMRPPRSRWARRLARTGWIVMFVLCLATLAKVSQYLRFDPSVYFEEQRAVYLRREVILGVHVGGAMLALAIGPLQFAARLRRRAPRLHRALGVGYLAGVTAGGVAGLLMAPTAYGGAITSVGFAALGVCWLVVTWIGGWMIVTGRVLDHRLWMVRSFALTFGGVNLRLLLIAHEIATTTGVTTLPF